MKRLTKEEYIEKARKVHGNKYDYSKIEYVDNRTKICIVCPIHGEFWQEPNAHLQGQGCPSCGMESKRLKRKMTLEAFIEKARKVHGDKYDYSNINYINNRTNIRIICPIHGEFWQTPTGHLNGYNCPYCSKRHKLTKDDFIERARKVHGDKYDYSKVEYLNIDTKVCIICPIHGEFWQTPYHHMEGNSCPLCRTSKLEKEIELLLKENNIEYIRNTKDILGKLELDFFIPSKNVAIECQGIQHFMPSRLFGKEEYEKTLKRDKKKYELCNEKGIKLLYYSNLGIKYPYEVYENKLDILKILTE